MYHQEGNEKNEDLKLKSIGGAGGASNRTPKASIRKAKRRAQKASRKKQRK